MIWCDVVWCGVWCGVVFADKHLEKEVQWFGSPGEAPLAPWMFALAGREHMKRSGRGCVEGRCVEGGCVEGRCVEGGCVEGGCVEGGSAEGACQRWVC